MRERQFSFGRLQAETNSIQILIRLREGTRLDKDRRLQDVDEQQDIVPSPSVNTSTPER